MIYVIISDCILIGAAKKELIRLSRSDPVINRSTTDDSLNTMFDCMAVFICLTRKGRPVCVLYNCYSLLCMAD